MIVVLHGLPLNVLLVNFPGKLLLDVILMFWLNSTPNSRDRAKAAVLINEKGDNVEIVGHCVDSATTFIACVFDLLRYVCDVFVLMTVETCEWRKGYLPKCIQRATA